MPNENLTNNLNFKEAVWVELETNKGEDHYHDEVKLSCSYRGMISLSDFNRILDNPSDPGFVKLERVYWIENVERRGKKINIYPIRFGYDYIYRNFLGSIFLRINQIVALSPIDGKKENRWIEKAFLPSKEKKKQPPKIYAQPIRRHKQ
jgi:hypothetical protein